MIFDPAVIAALANGRIYAESIWPSTAALSCVSSTSSALSISELTAEESKPPPAPPVPVIVIVLPASLTDTVPAPAIVTSPERFVKKDQ